MRKDFLTPPDAGSGVTCRTLTTPSNAEWLGVFNSALLTLTETWRWEQVNLTDLTPAEAAAQCQQILNQFWSTSECDTCFQPSGLRFLRVNPDGSVQELNNGEWQEPTGDYEPVPPPAREGGTPDDQICLAAKNAVNALHLLYEDLADSYGEGLSQADAFTKFLLAVAAVIAAWIALWVAAIVAVVGIIFSIIYDTLEFVTADLWDDDFTKALTCIFIGCATNTAGVVTFDYECLVNELAANTDPLGDLTAAQLRLFGQILYIFQFIGADGLNAAGGTTAIADDDCDYCNDHCFHLNLRETNGSGLGLTISGGTYISGQGVQAIFDTAVSYPTWGYWNFGVDVNVIRIEMLFSKPAASGGNNSNRFTALVAPVTSYAATLYAQDFGNSLGTNLVKNFNVSHVLRGLGWDVNTGDTSSPLAIVHGFKVYYNGDIPTGWEDNCEE